MAERITDKLVKELEAPPRGNWIVYDGDHKGAVSGFGIRITAAGARSFVLNYRNVEGRERRYTIGLYGRNE
ncbi:MAG: Arm DNA-binding domain-containing protein, partial [Alphaproteobacteria bacterium]